MSENAEDVIDMKIFGWSVYRVYRNNTKQIIRIQLQKDHEIQTFDFVGAESYSKKGGD